MENNALNLSINGLSCIRGGREVFSNLSIELNYGEALLVTGENGSGKTTLLRLLAGLLPCEKPLIFSNAAFLRDDLHFIGPLDGVKTQLTVKENLNFWRGMLAGAEDALKFWELQELQDVLARFLSSGQRRRLALCRLMIAKRKLWLLDEPDAALDGNNQIKLLSLLARHLDEGGMAVIATHERLNIARAKELCMSAQV